MQWIQSFRAQFDHSLNCDTDAVVASSSSSSSAAAAASPSSSSPAAALDTNNVVDDALKAKVGTLAQVLEQFRSGLAAQSAEFDACRRRASKAQLVPLAAALNASYKVFAHIATPETIVYRAKGGAEEDEILDMVAALYKMNAHRLNVFIQNLHNISDGIKKHE